MSGQKYLIVSPVKDEGSFVARTLKSILQQTLKPVCWIIVDDASRDATSRILAEVTAGHDFIRVIRRDSIDTRRKPGGGVIEAFNFGIQSAKGIDYDFVVKLDCDLEIPCQYFESLLRRFNEDPRLGIASGVYLEERRKSEWRAIAMPSYHAAGAAKTIRRECFEQIGGFVASHGWDTVDEIKAMSRGWATKHFSDLRLRHLKPEGSGIGMWRTGILRGEIFYLTGGGRLFFALKALCALFAWPPLAVGTAMFWGYLRAMQQRLPLLVSPREAAYYRSLLNRRLLALGRRLTE